MQRNAVILWFGDECFLLWQGECRALELPAHGDVAAALSRTLAGLTPKPRQVRLVYQPADLELHAVECVKGSRSVLRDALADEHPELRHPGCVWAASRLHATEAGYATLLWIEASGRLHRVRDGLATCGIRLAGAWPVTSLLELTPPAERAGESVLALIMTDSGGLVYAVTPGGARTVLWCTGEEHRGQLGGVVRNTLTHFDRAEPPPVLLVDGSSEHIDVGVTPLAGIDSERITLSELLQRAERLDPRDLSNFLPPASRVTANLVVWLAAAACAVASLANAGLYWRDYRRLQTDAGTRAQIARDLRSANDRLRGNQAKVGARDALNREMEVAGRNRLKLLAAIMREKPVELTIHSVTTNGRAFEVTGTAHEGVGQSRGPYYRFVDALAARTNPWQLSPESRPANLPAAEFVVTGTFR